MLRRPTMGPSQNLGLHHVAIRVIDMAAMRRFYVEILGFCVERQVADEELWLTTGNDSFVFLRSEGPVSAPALDHVGLIVPAAPDVSEWEKYLRNHQIPILESTEVYDDESVGMICCDPAGHRVQVLWHPTISDALLGKKSAPQQS